VSDLIREQFEECVSKRSKHAYLLLDRVDQEYVIRSNISPGRIGQYVQSDVEEEWQKFRVKSEISDFLARCGTAIDNPAPEGDGGTSSAEYEGLLKEAMELLKVFI